MKCDAWLRFSSICRASSLLTLAIAELACATVVSPVTLTRCGEASGSEMLPAPQAVSLMMPIFLLPAF